MQPDRGPARTEQAVRIGGQGLQGAFQAQRRGDAPGEGNGEIAKPLVEGSCGSQPLQLPFGSPPGSLRGGGFDEFGSGPDVTAEVAPGSSAGLCHRVERHSKMLKGKGKRASDQDGPHDV